MVKIIIDIIPDDEIIPTLQRIEKRMSEIDANINAKLDVIEGAIAAEAEQGAQIVTEVSTLRLEVANLQQQLDEVLAGNPVAQETLDRIDALATKIEGIVVP